MEYFEGAPKSNEWFVFNVRKAIFVTVLGHFSELFYAIVTLIIKVEYKVLNVLKPYRARMTYVNDL